MWRPTLATDKTRSGEVSRDPLSGSFRTPGNNTRCSACAAIGKCRSLDRRRTMPLPCLVAEDVTSRDLVGHEIPWNWLKFDDRFDT